MTDFSLPAAGARVRSAVETVYNAFDAPTPPAIEGCPCCIDTRGVDVLLTTPLRQLTGYELSRYVSGVFLTIGSEQDFRYFLPRILDISIHDTKSVSNPEIVLGKLRLPNWQSWPAAERRLVEELVDGWFQLALARDLTNADEWWISSEAEGVLCGAALAGLPLAPWLKRLNEPPSSPVLTDLKNRYPRQLSAFWEDAPAGLEELSTILTGGER